MYVRYFVCAFLHALAASAANAAEPNSAASIQFDGVYIGTPSADADADAYCHYLRFYPRGSVITVSSACGQSALADIKRWFTFKNSGPKKTGTSRGRAKIEDKRISFAAVSREGTVSYWGEIEDGHIHLKTYSHINKHRGEDSYKFVKW
jgi:hypothetical protein